MLTHFVASQVHEVTGERLLPAELELLQAADMLLVEARQNFTEVLRSGGEAAIARCRREMSVAFEWAALLTCDVMAGKLRGPTGPDAPKPGEASRTPPPPPAVPQ
jgi:hypothetical protein